MTPYSCIDPVCPGEASHRLITSLCIVAAQRINHFHGMLALCRKASMARLLAAMAAASPPGAFEFVPRTWLLPAQLPALLDDARAAGQQQAYIIKPDAGCQVCEHVE